ncbi:MAG TPA: OmpA family protein [Stellaceae bacterium]|jgi:outer membrane protein OmpA-like peptidoglycan-associated protein|nr:OmpA family protein [Stellaceae bacterium]
MKNSIKFLAAALLATVSTAAMADPLVGPYVELGVGANHPNTFSSNLGGNQWNYNWGISTNLTGGYSFGDQSWAGNGGLRAEFEFGYLQSSVNHYAGASPAVISGGTLKQFSYMVNGLYDFDQLGWPVIPHVGIGAGASSVHQGSTSGVIVAHLQGFRPSVQGIVGVEYPIPGYRGLNLGIDYRYMETFNLHETANTPASGHGNLGDHNILVTLRYTFAAPSAPPAPVPAPAPVAAPARAPEAQRAFQVFFDFNKSNITAEAAATIQKAAATVKAGHVATINVTGHTDTVGSAKYNLALSQRRAVAVKQQLVADGVSASEIATTGVGKSGLLVPTPDGVREPQNRRAEIVLQ